MVACEVDGQRDMKAMITEEDAEAGGNGNLSYRLFCMYLDILYLAYLAFVFIIYLVFTM